MVLLSTYYTVWCGSVIDHCQYLTTTCDGLYCRTIGCKDRPPARSIVVSLAVVRRRRVTSARDDHPPLQPVIVYMRLRHMHDWLPVLVSPTLTVRPGSNRLVEQRLSFWGPCTPFKNGQLEFSHRKTNRWSVARLKLSPNPAVLHWSVYCPNGIPARVLIPLNLSYVG